MSLCDELYGEAKRQLDQEEGEWLQAHRSPSDLDRRVLRLICERVEKLIADSHRHTLKRRSGSAYDLSKGSRR